MYKMKTQVTDNPNIDYSKIQRALQKMRGFCMMYLLFPASHPIGDKDKPILKKAQTQDERISEKLPIGSFPRKIKFTTRITTRKATRGLSRISPVTSPRVRKSRSLSLYPFQMSLQKT